MVFGVLCVVCDARVFRGSRFGSSQPRARAMDPASPPRGATPSSPPPSRPPPPLSRAARRRAQFLRRIARHVALSERLARAVAFCHAHSGGLVWPFATWVGARGRLRGLPRGHFRRSATSLGRAGAVLLSGAAPLLLLTPFAFPFWAADMALPAASAGVGGAIGPFLGSRGASAICPGSGGPFTAGLRLGLLPLGGLPSVGLPACPGGPPRNGLSAIGHGSRGFLASVSRPRPNHVFTGPGRSGALDLRSLAGPGRRGAPKPFCILLGPGCQRAPKVFYTVRGARWRRGPECVSRTWNGTTWHGLGRPCAAWQGSALFLLVRSN